MSSSSPTTALQRERARTTFDPAVVKELLHGPLDVQKQVAKWEQLFSSNPLFDRRDDIYLSRPDYIRKAIQRSFATFHILRKNKDLLAAHSPLHGDGGLMLGDFGVSTGISDHFGLFVGTLLLQATREQQQKWLRPALNLNIIGTYAQTELGHGTNTRGLETTATYDKDTDEFIVHSPTVSSTKWWPGGLGLLATHAVLYASLIVDGKDLGFHAFLVPLRDEHHNPLPGVECGDIGPKMGYGAYDSGYLRLDSVRIPRFNMLARFQQLAKGGAYTQAPKSLQKIAYFTMLRTRVLVAVCTGKAVARSATIAVRYSAARLQGFIDTRKGGEEKPVIDHRVQQTRLVQIVSTATVLMLSTRLISNMFNDVEHGLKIAGSKNDADSRAKVERALALLPELHGLSTGLKAFTTDIAIEAMDEARKLCGGQGFALHSGFGIHYYNNLPGITFEGDIVPMALQCGRFLFKSYISVMTRKSNTLEPSVRYLAGKRVRRLVPVTAEEMMLPRVSVLQYLEATARDSVARASYRLVRLLRSSSPRLTFDAAWNECHALFVRASRAHVMYLLAVDALTAVSRNVHDAAARSVVELQISFFALRHLTSSLQVDAKLSPREAEVVDEAVEKIVTRLRPDLVTLVDCFNCSDFALTTTIGNYENSDMYERIMDATRRNPVNDPNFVKTFHSDLLASFLNKELIAAGAKAQSELTINGGGSRKHIAKL